MNRIRLDKVDRLLEQATRIYELGQKQPTEQFDAAVEELILVLDDVCTTLEEIGRDAAKKRETVGIEGMHDAVRMTDAAMTTIDSVRRYFEWGYKGTRPGKQEMFQEDVSVVGLWTLKGRFEELMLQITYERVRTIVRNTLAERFSANDFVFEPIVVTRTGDKFGDGSTYIRILVVFDGMRDQLDPGWTYGFLARIRPKLVAAGVDDFPSVSFIEKSEWWASYPEAHLRNPEETQLVEFPSGAREFAA